METSTPFQKLFELQEDLEKNREWSTRVTKEINSALTRIFLVVFSDVAEMPSSVRPKYAVTIDKATKPALDLSCELLATKYQIIAERMKMWRPQDCLLEGPSGLSSGLFSKDVAILADKVPYLAYCYGRASVEPEACKITGDLKATIVRQVKEKIVEWAADAIIAKHQLLLRSSNRQIKSEFSELCFLMLTSQSPLPRQFFVDVGQRYSGDVGKLTLVYEPVLGHLLQLTQGLKLDSSNVSLCFDVMEFFTGHEVTAKALVNSSFWRPASHAAGNAFETQCVLGGLLKLSSVSPTLMQPSEQFYSDHDLTNVEIATQFQAVQNSIQQVVERLHQVFKSLLRLSPLTKRGLVEWLVDCFHRNSGRTKMINTLSTPSPTLASDGFFLNLSWVMLKLSEPLMGKALMVDPLYCVATSQQASEGDSVGPYVDFSKETRLTAAPSGMTQALNTFEQVLRAYGQVREHTSNLPVAVSSLQLRMLTSQILGFKAHATHVELLSLCLSFYTTTAQWLVHLVSPQLAQGQVSAQEIQVSVPLLAVPECLVENMADFAMFLRQKDTGRLENINAHMNHLITFITVFMGNSKLVHNPHVRAKLALLLSLMLPSGQGSEPQASLSGEDFFYSHDVAKAYLIEALLKVFIDIEFTGHSFQFENKFKYRIPMYDILEYLWKIPSYRPSIELLSEQAVRAHDATEISLFLRFINMILNDATLQLDEGLQSLAIVKEVEEIQSSPEWGTLTNEQRRVHLDKLNEASMMAKNRNFLAMKTVHALAMITMDTRRPCVVPTLVDRLVAMLNYVLQHLVGPKRNELKVKDLHKYNFNPKELTKSLMSVYLNLGQEPAFCEALPRDQRSFSIDLLCHAEQVLSALREDDMVAELRHLVQRVQKCCDDMKMEEERYEDAPEEFLDPLMSTLMSDPVILPTSGVSMDRVNVIRHLLSDMSDPFNRQPLTLDMLVPNKNLRKRIEEWKANRK